MILFQILDVLLFPPKKLCCHAQCALDKNQSETLLSYDTKFTQRSIRFKPQCGNCGNLLSRKNSVKSTHLVLTQLCAVFTKFFQGRVNFTFLHTVLVSLHDDSRHGYQALKNGKTRAQHYLAFALLLSAIITELVGLQITIIMCL